MASKPLMVIRIEREVVPACKTDDVFAMSQIINTVIELGSTTIKQEVLDFSINHAIKANASRVLSYILKEGADERRHPCNLNLNWGTFDLPTLTTLDILMAHGWDINSYGIPGSYSEPLLWNVLRHPELVERCLYHGARVDLNDPEKGGPRPILERAAVHGNVEIFELLRSRDAPLSPRVLPMAVRAANDYVAMDNHPRSRCSRR